MALRLAYVTYVYPPLAGAGAHRPLKLSKYLPSFDVDVTVFACGNDLTQARDPSYVQEIPPVADVRRVSHPGYTLARRILKKLGRGDAGAFPDQSAPWSRKVAQVLKRTSNQFDVIYVSGPPFSSFQIASSEPPSQCPVVLEYRDEWTGNSLLMKQWRADEIEAMKRIERQALGAASAVVTVSQDIASTLCSTMSLPAARMHVVENGYDEEDFTGMPELPVSEKFRCVYVGYLYEGRSPEWWWQALAELRKERPEVTQLMDVTIYGRMNIQFSRMLDAMGLMGWIRCVGQVDHRDAIHALTHAHLPVVISETSPEASGWPGGKIYECLRTGAPLLVTGFPDSAKDRLLKSCDAGQVIGIDDVQGMKRFMLDQVLRWQKGLWARKPVPDALRAYDRRNLAKRLAGILHDIANQHRAVTPP